MRHAPGLATSDIAKRVFDSFSKLGWNGLSQTSWPLEPLRVSVAVSGGPDSMALAYLISRIAHPTKAGTAAFAPKGIIIDHRLRSGSSQEASRVQDNLRKIGIISRVFTLKDVPPVQSLKVEGWAREKRYELLAQAMTAQKTKFLFLGHHADDAAEGTILRLLRDTTYQPLSFVPLQDIATLPCSETIHGALPCLEVNESSYGRGTVSDLRKVQGLKGRYILRPLLHTQKEQLIMLCEQSSIPYVTDQTNLNPCYTLRNAVRHLWARHKLPQALSKEFVHRFNNQAQHISQSLILDARTLFKSATAFQLDVGASRISLTVPWPIPNKFPRNRRAMRYVLARLAEAITGQRTGTSSTLASEEILVELETSADNASKPIRIFNALVRKNASADSEHLCLMFTRTPIARTQLDANNQAFELDHTSSLQGHDLCTNWLFWDRYVWIRLRVLGYMVGTLQNIRIRPFRSDQKDYEALKAAGKGPNGKIADLFSKRVPVDGRRSLPVLALNDHIIALPTLNLFTSQEAASWLRYEVEVPIHDRVLDLFCNDHDGYTEPS